MSPPRLLPVGDAALSVEFGVTGKLCETPVQPLSRSVLVLATTRSISSGPPAAFAPVQDGGGGGMVVVVVLPGVEHSGFGVHLILRVSLSCFGLMLESAVTLILVMPGFCLPFLVVLRGTTTPVEVPHAVLERSGTFKG